MDFAGRIDPAIERVLIGDKRLLVTPRAALKEGEVIPAVGQLRRGFQQPLMRLDRLADGAGFHRRGGAAVKLVDRDYADGRHDADR